MAEFDRSRVVVAGASSGIGRAVAELAGRSGARALGLNRTGASPQGVTGTSADARDDAQVSAALARTDRSVSRAPVLVAYALRGTLEAGCHSGELRPEPPSLAGTSRLESADDLMADGTHAPDHGATLALRGTLLT